MIPMKFESLPESQRAFQLDSGQLVVVEITQGVTTSPERESPIKIRSWPVNESGGRIIEDGVPVEFPAKVETIMLASVGEGKITIDGERARATVEALERAARMFVAREAWAKIPK
ncbi:MAG: hypothetical protein L0312_26635 [Acidobacteria bacterium]|nr:hypothetical protein [Acidobacteriota bacterium]